MSFAPPGPPPRRACEIDRAFRELLGRPWIGRGDPTSGCSPEPPEVRSFPAPLPAGDGYALCNGHLRDLFEALEGARRGSPSAPGTVSPT
jgi:hypothetical protein